VAAAALCFLAFFGEALLGRKVFFASDMELVYLPARHYLVERVGQGAFPEWYPYDGLGASFVGSVVTGACHPFGLLELLGSRALALNWSVVLAHVAAASGLFALLRRWGQRPWPSWAAGLAYAFSGYLSSMDSNLPYLLTAGALPWALWGLEAGLSGGLGPLALGAFALASCALGGDPQGFAVTAALAASLALARAKAIGWGRAGGRFALYAAWAVLLSAVQALPALDAVGSVVAGLRSLEQVQWFSLAPLRFVDFVIAHPFVESADAPQPTALFGVQGFGGLWADSLYLGAPALALGFAALRCKVPRAGWLFVVAALGVLLALGRHLPLYALVYRALPVWRAFRYPEKLLVFTTFALAALAGLGLQAVRDRPLAARAFARVMALSALALWGAALAALAGEGGPLGRAVLAASPAPDAANLAQLWPGLTRQLLVTAAMASAAGLSLLSRLEWLGALALAASLVAGNRGLVQSYLAPSSQLLRPPAGLAAVLAQGRGDSGEADRPRVRWDEGDLGALFGVENVEGYLPIAGAGIRPRLLSRLSKEIADRAFAVRFRLAEPNQAPLPVAAPAPRIRLARALSVSGPEAALAAMQESGFDPSGEVAVEGGSAPCERAAAVEVEAYAPEHLRLRTRSRAVCALFVADGWDSGWRASLDGEAVKVLPADVFGRAVMVPPGEHRVELFYRAPGLRAGALLSLSGLAWMGMALVASAHRARRSQRLHP
jgi:hypothetical protein